MKFSTISVILMAAVPALATDYSLVCSRDYLYHGEKMGERKYTELLYKGLCVDLYGCSSSVLHPYDPAKDQFVSGDCLNCRPDLTMNDNGNCVLTYKI
ncbi:hypothetical protein E4U54_001310 [Claviceps lovelessii]|nr:hypothetical protein E4U54_001310 [Claviceps lovelessii]